MPHENHPAPEKVARSRILIVDDDPLSRRLVMRSLEHEYEVIECRSGLETMQMLEGAGPALVVLDYQMPDLNGAQVCELVRSSPDPEVAQCPIIMLTGHSNVAHEIECLRSGADDFVTKPLNVAVLRARIETHLRLHTLRKQLLAQNVELEAWRRRQEEDLEAARLTQQAILPARLPVLHGWDFAAQYLPLMRIGGDMYDWHKIHDGPLLVWITDATGHGASAALLTTLSKLLFRHAIAETQTPAGIMDYVEREFQAVFKGHSFMTAACLALNAEDGRITFCGAGQPPLLVSRTHGHVEFMRSMRPPLGLNKAEHSIEEGCDMAPGEALLLYTDGLYEIQNKSGARLGNEALAKLLPRASGGLTASVWLQEVIEKAGAYADSVLFPDDIAVFAARRE
jgi:sigma-B regulation protein RsbU (phosphoserine phosphatase)